MGRRLDRRELLRAASVAAGGLALTAWLPAWARSGSAGIAALLPALSGDVVDLRIARQTLIVDGKASEAIGVNGTVPAPLLRLRQGQRVRLRVTNDLDEDSSIHWHGLLVPPQFDGVPGISFPGIGPHSTFVYDFEIKQAGTYWYHSHSGLQEQLGHYGPIIIDPAEPDPVAYEREHVIVLADHSFQSPSSIFRRLKVDPGYYNFQRQTLVGLLSGKDQALGQRFEWAGMRMDPTDMADVTAAAYTYLVNGHGPLDNWTALFAAGERVRLRIINASAMTTFNVRIPGLPMTIVQADGLNVRPVETDELQIGVAETYDAIVTPDAERAYTLVGESVDRYGMACATLAPRLGMSAPVPGLRRRPLATMKSMGMQMGDGGMAGMDHGQMGDGGMAGMDHGQMGDGGMAGMDHGQMGDGGMAGMDHGKMGMRDFSHAPGVDKNPGVQTIAPQPVDRTGERGQGLEDVDHRVLVYRDLVALDRNPDTRSPQRSLDIHLTGNMERFMWSFDGVKMSDAKTPFPFSEGERVRITLINDTMMGHPIHLHGHFFELVTGHGAHAPRKHTVHVQPGGKVTFDLTADTVGDWAFHCHLLYHMHAGMMRVVTVRPRSAAT